MGAVHSLPFGASTSRLTFVLSMTTTPWRLNAELETRVLGLIDALPQNYTLAMNVPYVLKRDNSVYPAVPSGFWSHPRIYVLRGEDQGPMTKLLPTLTLLHASGAAAARTVVVALDDDIVYPPQYIMALTQPFDVANLTFAVGNAANVPGSGPLPQGYLGYGIPVQVVTRELLSDLETLSTNPQSPCFTADDFVVGKMLAKHGVSLRGFSLNKVPHIDTQASDADPKGLLHQNHEVVYKTCDAYMKSM